MNEPNVKKKESKQDSTTKQDGDTTKEDLIEDKYGHLRKWTSDDYYYDFDTGEKVYRPVTEPKNVYVQIEHIGEAFAFDKDVDDIIFELAEYKKEHLKPKGPFDYLKIDVDVDHRDNEVNQYLIGVRKETQEEMEARLEKISQEQLEKQKESIQKQKQQEAKERKLYEKLKAKFEGDKVAKQTENKNGNERDGSGDSGKSS